jgi:hypothetical protein
MICANNNKKIRIGLVHFERTHHLERLCNEVKKVQNFLISKEWQCSVWICDDSIKEFHREKCRRLASDFNFVLKQTDGIAGLSVNSNQLLTDFDDGLVMQIQDDFTFIGKVSDLYDELEIFIRSNSIYHKLYLTDGELSYFDYSDTPHIKKKDFHLLVGFYPVNLPMHKAELLMKKIAIEKLTINELSQSPFDLFAHLGENESFNPAHRKPRVLKRLRLFVVYMYVSSTVKKLIRFIS